MACEICGKNNCTSSFHSIEEQRSFDEVADKIKDRMKVILTNQIEKLDGYYDSEDSYHIKLSEVLEIIDNY